MTAEGLPTKRLAGGIGALVVLAGAAVYLASRIHSTSPGSAGASRLGVLGVGLIGIVIVVLVASITRNFRRGGQP